MKNLLIKGAPGTGKTYNARRLAYYLCNALGEKSKDYFESKKVIPDSEVEDFIQSYRCEYIQVHPSMTFDDIVFGAEIKADSFLDTFYAEKRVKKICDLAVNSREFFCIILDDVSRSDPEVLLGGLIYAMEYRNQPVPLFGAQALVIPENVIFILTEGVGQNFSLNYSIYRRMESVIELRPDRNAIERFYTQKNIDRATVKAIIDIFDFINDFITPKARASENFAKDLYLPGHGYYIVESFGTTISLWDKLLLKTSCQLIPYLQQLKKTGIISCNLEELEDAISSRINTGIQGQQSIQSISKKFLNKAKEITTFTLSDAKQYFCNGIINQPYSTKICKDAVECIVDAIILNNILPDDVAWHGLLTNTAVAYIQNPNNHADKVSYVAPLNSAANYFYETPKGGRTVSHAFYSNRPSGERWKQDAIKYTLTYNDGRPDADFLPLTGFRSHNFTIQNPKLDPGQSNTNTANVYPAIYRLVDHYISLYKKSLNRQSFSSEITQILCSYLDLEEKYLRAVDKEMRQTITNEGPKTEYFWKKIINFYSLWSEAGATIEVDRAIFQNLSTNPDAFSVAGFERMFSSTNPRQQITFQGVYAMTKSTNYQAIMDEIGVRQMIFQGPPGTSKTFESQRFVLRQFVEEDVLPDSPERITEALREYKLTSNDYECPKESLKLHGGWDIVQFHPSYGYEDFVRGIEVNADNGQVVYNTINKLLGQIADFAKYAKEKCASNTPLPKFYLIIDEINRANLATVFGELIYALEYRSSEVATPYEVKTHSSGLTKSIVIENNLYIIGTMNTADKSISGIDYAIRRRFIFIDSPASRDVVVKCYKKISKRDDEECFELLLFDAVQKLFDSQEFFNSEYQKNDVRLGHTYFLRNNNSKYIDIAIGRFLYQALPVLREYFKDGILECSDDIVQKQSSAADIQAAGTFDLKSELLSCNIMFYIKEFANKDMTGNVINNDYIDSFLRDLSGNMNF